MDIIICEALINDVDALIKCHSRFMEHHINVDERFNLRSGAEEKWHEQISQAVKNPDILVLVATANSVVVGSAYTLIKAGALDFGPEKIGYLCDVYVEPEFRRKGIARRFLSSALNWLLVKGIHLLETSWSVHSVEAQSTWPSLGFVPISISSQMEF
jgi:GNAT superfamily N-acetyltransferase